MNTIKPEKARYIASNTGEAGLILKIYRGFGKFRYTVQYGDGPKSHSSTLVPFLKSGFTYRTAVEAEEEAEFAISDFFAAE